MLCQCGSTGEIGVLVVSVITVSRALLPAQVSSSPWQGHSVKLGVELGGKRLRAASLRGVSAG